MAIGRHRDVEMVDTGADVGDDCGNLGVALGRTAIDDEYAHRLFEFPDSLGAAVELQLRVKGGLEKAVLDFVVAKTGSLARAAKADVGIFGACRLTR